MKYRTCSICRTRPATHPDYRQPGSVALTVCEACSNITSRRGIINDFRAARKSYHRHRGKKR